MAWGSVCKIGCGRVSCVRVGGSENGSVVVRVSMKVVSCETKWTFGFWYGGQNHVGLVGHGVVGMRSFAKPETLPKHGFGEGCVFLVRSRYISHGSKRKKTTLIHL